jgi:hypothetical protein
MTLAAKTAAATRRKPSVASATIRLPATSDPKNAAWCDTPRRRGVSAVSARLKLADGYEAATSPELARATTASPFV